MQRLSMADVFLMPWPHRDKGRPAGLMWLTGGVISMARVCHYRVLVEYRRAKKQDIEPIAAIHADSWRRNYRGAYLDAFLDGDVFDDRRAVWTERLKQPNPLHDTVVAEWHGKIVGFVHMILDDDPVWGALLDNLHVTPEIQRRGVGTQLMARSATAVMARGTHKRLYLMVLEGNAAAQEFYKARGGECVGSEASEPAGGGSIVGLRYVWTDPSVLLHHVGNGRSPVVSN